MDRQSEITPAMKRAMQMIAATKQSAGHQGPHDMKQAAALAEYLRDKLMGEGADGDAIVDTIVSMLNNPTDFAEEFAEVQGREAPPVLDGDDASMPMPAQEEAPPEATMPMPGMQPPPGSTTAKVAADNVADACPKCGSHTTGMLDGEGSSMCHGCGNKFQTEVDSAPVDSFRTADAEPELFDHEDLHVRDPNTPSSMRWLDSSGAPLEVGKEYEMHSNRSDIPDYIKILGPGAIDPDTEQMGGPVIGDTLRYEITGEYGLSHTGDLTLEEFEDEEISFDPTNDGDDIGDGFEGPDEMLENNGNSDRTMYEGAPEQRDLSKPTVNLASIIGRNARTDEFARDYDGPRPNAHDHSFPLVDAPHPNKFSSKERFEEATEEWKREYLTPALNDRASKSVTSVIKTKIASGEEISDELWRKAEALGGPNPDAPEVEGPMTQVNLDNWVTWEPLDEDIKQAVGDRDVVAGRGLILEPSDGPAVVHTWPVIQARLQGEPELFHAEHMQDVGWDPASDGRTAAVDIVWRAKEGRYEVEPNPIFDPTDEDLALLESVHPELTEGNFVMSKAAGAEFNLMEQKEFIGERGIARNADKLDLENTHYAETVEDHFLFGL